MLLNEVVYLRCLRFRSRFQIFASNMHQNEWFSSFIFQKISGEEHRAPSPNPFPVFARALPSVRAPLSIHGRFAPSIIGRFAASIRASPSTFNLRNWFDPQNIFLDPPVLVCALFGEFPDRLLICN